MIILTWLRVTYAYGLSYELILILELISMHSAVILFFHVLSYIDSSLPDGTSSAGGLLERCGPTF